MRPRELSLHPMTAKGMLRLKREAEADGAHRVARRIHVVLLNHDGYSSGGITTLLKVSRARVSEWLGNYGHFGYEGLLEGHRPGRPPALTAANKQTPEDIIDSGPLAYGYLSGVWTSPMIAQVIVEQFGVTYHPGYVCRLLHQPGFSVQRPKRQLARANAQQQDRDECSQPSLAQRGPPCSLQPIRHSPSSRPVLASRPLTLHVTRGLAQTRIGTQCGRWSGDIGFPTDTHHVPGRHGNNPPGPAQIDFESPLAISREL